MKVDEVREFLKSEPFQFIRLLDSDRCPLVPQNLIPEKIDIDRILKALKSNLNPDGLYYLGHRNTKTGKERFFTIVKGKELMTPNNHLKENESMTTIIDLNKEIERLKAENTMLQEKLMLAEEEEEEEIFPLQENNKDVFTTLISELAPKLIDKYFDLKEREIEAINKKTQSEKINTTNNFQNNLSEEEQIKNEVENIKSMTLQECVDLINSLPMHEKRGLAEIYKLYRTDYIDILNLCNKN